MVCPAAGTTVVAPAMRENAVSGDARESANASAKEQQPFPILRIRQNAVSTDVMKDGKNVGKKDARKDGKNGVRTDGMTDAAGATPADVSHKVC